MPQKTKTDSELWEALEALHDDLLDPDYPETSVDGELRELGVDPAALAIRGVEVAARLQDEQRLVWQVRARDRRSRMESRASSVSARVPLDRTGILKRLEELRSAHSRLGTSVAAAFRKRKAEESSEEELRALLEDMEALRAIEDGEAEQ